jgi:hypothetical protein
MTYAINPHGDLERDLGKNWEKVVMD